LTQQDSTLKQAGPEPATNGSAPHSPDTFPGSSVERPQSKARRRRWWPRTKLGVVTLVGIFLCAVLASTVLYIDGEGSGRIKSRGSPTQSGTTVAFNVAIIQNNYSELVGDLIVKPGPELLDPATDGLKQDLTVAVTSTTTPVKRTWSKGMLPGVFPVPLTVARDVERWPFDSYYTGPVTVSLFTGTEAPERANVTFVDRLTGWNIQVNRVSDASPTSPYVVTLERSASTMLFALVILLIFVAIAALALFVAIHTYRDPSKFQSPLTTWYAAMLFAVVPLRNALPGSPVFGSWIDLTIVLWVLVALVISMLLYIAAWARWTSKT
jgi:hypothetical protein